MEVNRSLLQEYVNTSPFHEAADFNYHHLKTFTETGKDVSLSQQLQGILYLGFFRRLQVILLNFLGMTGTSARVVADFAKQYFSQLSYQEPTTDLDKTYIFFHERGRPIQVSDRKAAKDMAAALGGQNLYLQEPYGGRYLVALTNLERLDLV